MMKIRFAEIEIFRHRITQKKKKKRFVSDSIKNVYVFEKLSVTKNLFGFAKEKYSLRKENLICYFGLKEIGFFLSCI